MISSEAGRLFSADRRRCAAGAHSLLALAAALLATAQRAGSTAATRGALRLGRHDAASCSLDVSFRDAIDSEILRKLTRGLPTTIVFTATLYRAGTRNALSTTAQTCKITWLVWDEAYLVEITQPTGAQQHRPDPDRRRRVAPLRGDATGLFVADNAQIPDALTHRPGTSRYTWRRKSR